MNLDKKIIHENKRLKSGKEEEDYILFLKSQVVCFSSSATGRGLIYSGKVLLACFLKWT